MCLFMAVFLMLNVHTLNLHPHTYPAYEGVHIICDVRLVLRYVFALRVVISPKAGSATIVEA